MKNERDGDPIAALCPPDVRDGLMKRAAELLDGERHADALEVLEGLLVVATEDARVWAWHALASLRLGATENAVHGFQRACELDPSCSAYSARLGEALIVAGRLDDAAQVLRAVIERDTDGRDPAAAWARELVAQVAKRVR